MKTLVYLLLFLPFIGVSQNSDFPKLKGPYLGQKPPGMIPEIFAPAMVEKALSCSFSADGKEFYFYRSIENAPVKIFVSKVVNEKWTVPEELSMVSGYRSSQPHVTLDKSNF